MRNSKREMYKESERASERESESQKKKIREIYFDMLCFNIAKRICVKIRNICVCTSVYVKEAASFVRLLPAFVFV